MNQPKEEQYLPKTLEADKGKKKKKVVGERRKQRKEC